MFIIEREIEEARTQEGYEQSGKPRIVFRQQPVSPKFNPQLLEEQLQMTDEIVMDISYEEDSFAVVEGKTVHVFGSDYEEFEVLY